MSIQAIAWVLDHSKAEGIDRLVLLALANHANSATGRCDPGYRRIAHEANCSRGTVANAVERLVKLGEVEIENTGRGRASTKYHLPWLSTGCEHAAVASNPGLDTEDAVASNGDELASKSDAVASNPGLDRSLNRTSYLTAHDAPTPSGDVAPKEPQVVTLSDGSRWHPDSGRLELPGHRRSRPATRAADRRDPPTTPRTPQRRPGMIRLFAIRLLIIFTCVAVLATLEGLLGGGPR